MTPHETLMHERREWDIVTGFLRNSLANRHTGSILLDCRRVIEAGDRLIEAERAVMLERCQEEARQ